MKKESISTEEELLAKMSKGIQDSKQLLETHGESGNWDYSAYMHGLYNGIELVIAMVEGRVPIFRDAPDRYLCELNEEMGEVEEALNVQNSN